MVKSILIIHRHLIYGGAEKYTLNLANALSAKGISVTLITGGGPLAAYVSPDVTQFTLPISRKPRMKQIVEKRILEIARACKPQIIHTQCRASMVNSQLARDVLNIPLVTHEHHMYELADYPFIVNELRDGADKIITIGPYTAKELVTNGLDKDGIVPVINGIDTQVILPIKQEERRVARELLRLSESDKVIVCLSRLEDGKGIDKLARGFIKIAQRVPEAKLFVVGDDERNEVKPFLRKIIEEHNLQDRFFVLPGEYNIRKYHAVADVFCYPALVKGMAVMEAMAAGLPIVGKKTDRQPLAVEHNVSGLMTEPTEHYRIDPDELAEKLTYLLNRPNLSKQMGKAARTTIEDRFNLQDHVVNILNVYNSMLEEFSQDTPVVVPSIEDMVNEDTTPLSRFLGQKQKPNISKLKRVL